MNALKANWPLYVLAGTVLVVYLVAGQLRGTLRPENVQFPEWKLADLPLQLGPWKGEVTKLDPRVAVAEGTDFVVDRLYYQEDKRDAVSVHTAMFSRYDAGVQHNPAVCYRTNGWKTLGSDEMQLQVGEGSPVSVRLSTWERDGDQVLVAYWYQLGDEILFDRGGLGQARLSLMGKTEWPPLLKVLLQTSGTFPQDARERIQSVAVLVYRWLQHAEPRAAEGHPTR